MRPAHLFSVIAGSAATKQFLCLPLMRVLLAFDKFKDSLTAPAACEAAARALRATHPEWSLDLCPLADGGEGFCEILTRAAGGVVESHTVTGPRGAPTAATLGFVALENDLGIGSADRTGHDQTLRAGERPNLGPQLHIPTRASIAVLDRVGAVDQAHPRRVARQIVDPAEELARGAWCGHVGGEIHVCSIAPNSSVDDRRLTVPSQLSRMMASFPPIGATP